mgnify:CR=1 FL=1
MDPPSSAPAGKKPAAKAADVEHKSTPSAADLTGELKALYEQYKDALKRGHVASLRGQIGLALHLPCVAGQQAEAHQADARRRPRSGRR